ncbi:MAG: glycosyltransferase, partial [Acidimicrobiales bacterium]|nr:glycosyltransferase [Acidimicrobiales bacterium]
VCDDGSTDDLVGALAPFGDRVTLLRQPNRGEGAAKNAAAAAASSDFVVLLDADDLFLPGRLAALGEAVQQRPDLDLVTTDAILSVDGVQVGTYYGTCAEFAVDDQATQILRTNFVFGLAAARRSRLLAVGGFDEAIRYTADWSGWMRLLLSGSAAGYVDEPLAVYRRHDRSLSANRAAMVRGRIDNLHAMAERHALSGAQQEVVTAALVAQARALPWEHLCDGVRGGADDTRRRGRALLREPGRARSERALAAAAVVSPRVARSVLHWAGTTTCGEPRDLGNALRAALPGRRA